jgi:nitrate/nitrite transport system substrate-binding protein
MMTDARKRMQDLGIRESQPKKIVILGKAFDPAKADEYVNSFAIKRT